MASKTTSCQQDLCDSCDPCVCKEKESSSSSSSSESEEEMVKDTVKALLDEFEERTQANNGQERVPLGCPIPQKYLYYGAIALPWTLFILDQLNIGACPWLNSTFAW